MNRQTHRRRLAATLLPGLLLGSLALAGCSERSPQQSTVPYQPGDGVLAKLGTIDVRNLLIVSAGANQAGVVSGALVNTGTSPVDVTFQAQGQSAASAPVTVPAGQLVKLGVGDGDTHIQIPTVAAPPGAVLPLQVSTPASGPKLLDVPVLNPSLQYATITPTPEPTTATETPTSS